jgi:arginine decarboxylase
MEGFSFVPREVFFTKGVGVHRERLASFEIALRDAGIAQFNLVPISSIIPPGCRVISREEGLGKLKPGQIIFVVLAKNETNEPNRLIAASIGMAKPLDDESYGYLSEHHSFGQTEKKAGDYAEDLAAFMLASTLGVPFDIDKSWDEQKEIWKISGRRVRTMSVTQSAVGNKDGMWTTVIAAAVFIP